MLYGLLTGCAIIILARWSRQPLGIEHGWSMAVLAVVLGPVLEEVIFRGYLLTFALWVTRLGSRQLSPPVSVISVAVLFSFVQLGKAGTTPLHLICIAATGCLYGWLRLTYQSAAPPRWHMVHTTAHFTSATGPGCSGCFPAATLGRRGLSVLAMWPILERSCSNAGQSDNAGHPRNGDQRVLNPDQHSRS
jgi:membrane protease YdiL (CAAX protease family)